MRRIVIEQTEETMFAKLMIATLELWVELRSCGLDILASFFELGLDI